MNAPLARYPAALALTALVGFGLGHRLLGRRRAASLWALLDLVLLLLGVAAVLLGTAECAADPGCLAFTLPVMMWANALGLVRSVQWVAALLACRSAEHPPGGDATPPPLGP